MCRFIETIRIVEGEIMGLPLHQGRVDRTLASVGTPGAALILEDVLADAPQHSGVWKARIVYDKAGQVVDKTFAPYTVRQVKRLQLVVDNGIDYSLKREDRQCLVALAAQKGNADEVIIVKDGRLTDTSYSNIALRKGMEWFTPSQPLLKGTMRRRLIDEGRLHEEDIMADNLWKYDEVCLINAMMPLGMCCLKTTDVFPVHDTSDARIG